jgi:hypothetical protein
MNQHGACFDGVQRNWGMGHGAWSMEHKDKKMAMLLK